MFDAININVPDEVIGSTVIWDDPGVYGFVSPRDRVGVVLAVEPSHYHGFYLLVRVEGFNLPKRITPIQIVAYAHPSLMAVA